jgi:hypothetical protein
MGEKLLSIIIKNKFQFIFHEYYKNMFLYTFALGSCNNDIFVY